MNNLVKLENSSIESNADALEISSSANNGNQANQDSQNINNNANSFYNNSVPVLSTHNITKTYGNINAVDDVSLNIQKGDIYGLVGLNGSGKTTLIRMITSLVKPTSGDFRLFGKAGSNTENLTRISSMIEKPAIYTNLSASDNLEAQCGIVGVAKEAKKATKERLLEMVGLQNVAKKQAKDFSLGMRQRLGIAMALVGDPEFMLLDEPTNGLDPSGIAQMRELLMRVNREQGITILICSHILVELAKMATRYGFIHRGKLIQEITSDELVSRCQACIKIETSDVNKTVDAFRSKGIEPRTTKLHNTIEIPPTVTVSMAYELLKPRGVEIIKMQSAGGDLESYFTNLITKYDAACANMGGYMR